VDGSTEAAVARDAAGAVGRGHPAAEADRGRHSRRSLESPGRPSPAVAATPAYEVAGARVSRHPTHRIGADG
jgi:hypothetical protein